MNQAAFRDLTVRQASFTAGAMRRRVDGERAGHRTPHLAGLGTITVRSALHLVLTQGTGW